MPLFEFECVECRSNIENCVKLIEKKVNKKVLSDLINKYENINAIDVVDLVKDKLIAKAGKKSKDSVYQDFYINNGDTLILFNIQNYRFSELIYEENDEEKVKCEINKGHKVEKVVSSFAFTSDLSTNMPKPDLSNMPPSVASKFNFSGYIEEKDRPKKNR